MSSDGTNRRKNEQERNRTNKVRGFGGVVKLGHVCTLIFYQTNQPVLLLRLPGRMYTNCPIQWRGSSFKNSLSGENLANESIFVMTASRMLNKGASQQMSDGCHLSNAGSCHKERGVFFIAIIASRRGP